MNKPICGMALMLPLWLAPVTVAETTPMAARCLPSDIHLRAGDELSSHPGRSAVVVDASGASLVRIHFGDYRLEPRSHIALTALHDGGYQKLDRNTLPIWSDRSAVFNGDAVLLELYTAPDDQRSYIRVAEISILQPGAEGGGSSGTMARSICGDHDNRIASNDARVGRLFFPYGGICTGWLISNGAALTAGHCGNPDGDLTGVIMEFNVPPSLANGARVASDPVDQYPVIAHTAQFEADGTGEDWSVYKVGPNSTSLNLPHSVQGAFRVTTVVPSEDHMMRVTGYGVDDMPHGTTAWHCLGGPSHGASCGHDGDCSGFSCVAPPCCDTDDDEVCNWTCNGNSGTQQTSIGRYDQLSGSTHEYEVDTMPGNSGGPVIWEVNGYTVGIHTAGGCDDFLAGYENHGTWFGYDPLASAVQNASPPNTLYVDRYAPSTFEFGGVFSPFHRVTGALNLAPSGTTIAILSGDYPAAEGNIFTVGADGRSFTLTAAMGHVTIGD